MGVRVWSLATALGLVFGAAACTSEVVGTGDGEGTSGGARGTSGTSGAGGTYEEQPGTEAPAGPPPVITSVSPLEGDYGTEVTIQGDNFDGATLVLGGGAEPLRFTMPAADTESKPSNVITEWSKTEIRFRYPFPADGSIRVTSPSGQAEGGTFVPTWRPGGGIAGELGRRQLLAVVSPAEGVLVAAFDGPVGPMIVVGGADGTIRTQRFERGSAALLTMSLYVTPEGRVDGFFSSGGTLWQLTDAAGAATTSSTGVAAEHAAGGHDATGPYAWIKNGTTLARVRPPAWDADLTVQDPTPAGAPGQSIAVSPDHALVVGWGVNDGGYFPFYDHTTKAVARRLRPGSTTFDASVTMGSGADDYMLWTRFFPGPDGRLGYYFCANDTGLFSSTTLDCRDGYLGGGAAPPSSSVMSSYVVGWNATTAVVAGCEVASATIKLGPETQTAEQVKTIFPCPNVIAVAADPTGAGHMLVQSGKYLYAPRAR